MTELYTCMVISASPAIVIATFAVGDQMHLVVANKVRKEVVEVMVLISIVARRPMQSTVRPANGRRMPNAKRRLKRKKEEKWKKKLCRYADATIKIMHRSKSKVMEEPKQVVNW